MKTKIFVLVVTLFSFFLSPAFAADSLSEKHWTTYGKVGYFSWVEHLENGQEFIRDDGMIYAAGITRNDKVLEHLSLTETFEVWGGYVAYDGETVYTGEEMRDSRNGYLGAREEVRVTGHVPFASITLNPFASIEHKGWSREVENELWNMVYSRIGMTAMYSTPKVQLYIGGGKTIPLYTANRWAVSDFTEFDDVTLRPKAKPGMFAEAGFKVGRWDVGVAYEQTDFKKSPTVWAKGGPPVGGGASKKGSFWQPKSSTSTGWLKIGYSF
ncbi:MAG: hypothetical protein UT41_C0002G0022 [Candidatus Wolfebacteria bacterium GW2011_GWC2_39_22]|uniref:Outer membrane protein beta-barrel domain-containing protein n=1 Tax=Candidatus Wolfebacteria bacterium GW2011_GWC2_39_22 TaxID=1619013 RepID=A0A0G0N9W8_9BACT|nr:MAG: hypothetical protein UT41_C0002G0022 [Candidatus Wolfebacteria bacterium GW2011_GWC2_39_22]HBI25883.1 hypothetical protein [Candidatus Wolfebacteria bacterium]